MLQGAPLQQQQQQHDVQRTAIPTPAIKPLPRPAPSQRALAQSLASLYSPLPAIQRPGRCFRSGG